MYIGPSNLSLALGCTPVFDVSGVGFSPVPLFEFKLIKATESGVSIGTSTLFLTRITDR